MELTLRCICSPFIFQRDFEGGNRVQEVFTKTHITQSEKIPIRERVE